MNSISNFNAADTLFPEALFRFVWFEVIAPTNLGAVYMVHHLAEEKYDTRI